jgi:hypothetical protein
MSILQEAEVGDFPMQFVLLFYISSTGRAQNNILVYYNIAVWSMAFPRYLHAHVYSLELKKS